MTLTGIPLNTFAPGAFKEVPDQMGENPAQSFDLAERLGPKVSAWVRAQRGLKPTDDLMKAASSIPMRAYALITRDELCKVQHSTFTMLDASVEDAFKADPTLRLFAKVRSSLWRWGCARGHWNELVAAYEGIRSFDLGHPAFALTLDHTTGYNERGFSEHSRTFLDGVFGYLVHYKAKHVMTIGLSVMGGRRVLLQQVQAKSRTGNRWLYKLPRNLTEHVLDRLAIAFPHHALFVADGADLMGETLQSYRRGLAREREAKQRALRSLGRDPSDESARRRLASAKADIREFREKIAHARADRPRIAAAYAATGRHVLGKAVKVNGLRHYAVTAETAPAAMAA